MAIELKRHPSVPTQYYYSGTFTGTESFILPSSSRRIVGVQAAKNESTPTANSAAWFSHVLTGPNKTGLDLYGFIVGTNTQATAAADITLLVITE